MKGQTAHFVCLATGFPKPTVTWQKNGGRVPNLRRISIMDGILTINMVRVTDEADYTCIASNEIGMLDSVTFNLSVASESDVCSLTLFGLFLFIHNPSVSLCFNLYTYVLYLVTLSLVRLQKWSGRLNVNTLPSPNPSPRANHSPSPKPSHIVVLPIAIALALALDIAPSLVLALARIRLIVSAPNISTVILYRPDHNYLLGPFLL